MKKLICILLIIALALPVCAGAEPYKDLTPSIIKEYKPYIDFCKTHKDASTIRPYKDGALTGIVLIIPKKKITLSTSGGNVWDVEPERPFVMMSAYDYLTGRTVIIISYLIKGSYKSPENFFFATVEASSGNWIDQLCTQVCNNGLADIYMCTPEDFS